MQNQYYWALTDEEYIAHHGILGQKWGVRRYQNPDGSLTEEGRQHVYKNGIYKKNIFGKKVLTKEGEQFVKETKQRMRDYYNNMSKKDMKKRDKAYAKYSEAHKKAVNLKYGDDKDYIKKVEREDYDAGENFYKFVRSDVDGVFGIKVGLKNHRDPNGEIPYKALEIASDEAYEIMKERLESKNASNLQAKAAPEVKSAIEKARDVVMDTITDPRVVGTLDTLIRTGVYNAVR